MRAFFQRLYYYYFYTWLAVLLLGIYPLLRYYLKHPEKHPKAHRLRQRGCRLLLRLTFIRSQAHGLQHLDPAKQYIIVSNHTSNLDIMATLATLPLYFIYLGKAELADIPFFGIFFRTMDIAVERENGDRSAAAFLKAARAVKEGKSIVVFAEGGILGDYSKLKPFKDGAFQLALRLKAPILPMSMPDNWRVLPDEPGMNKIGKPGKIRLFLHEPVPAAGLRKEDLPELKQRVFDIIEQDIIAYAK